MSGSMTAEERAAMEKADAERAAKAKAQAEHDAQDAEECKAAEFDAAYRV